MNKFILPLLSCFAFAATCAAEMPDEERYDFDKEVGPFTTLRVPPDPAPNPKDPIPAPMIDTTPGAAKSGAGALKYSYMRKAGRLDVLSVGIPLTEFSLLEFDLRGSGAALVGIMLDDLDGAKFHYICELRNPNWRHITLQPEDFKLSDDSPVKKKELNPDRIGAGFGIIDLSMFQKKPDGPATFWLDNLVVKRKPMAAKTGGWTVTRDTSIEVSTRIDGTLVVDRGITLNVKAKRFQIRGNVQLKEGATLHAEDTSVELPCSYPYQYNFALADKSKLELVRCKAALPLPWGVQLKKNSKADLQGTTFSACGFTFDVQEGSALSLLKTVGAGEAVIAPASQVRVNESAGLLLWFALPPNEPHRFDFPNGLRVERWTAPSSGGHDVSITASQGLMWGLVPVDGCDLTSQGVELRAVGLFFKGDSAREVKGLQNGTTYSADPVLAGHSKLKLGGSKVQSWNFYPAEKAVVNVEGCTFGEALCYGEAKLNVSDSTCDGSGGYFGARDKSAITAKKCKFTGRVIAHDDAKIVLEDCEIDGDALAADRGSLTLIHCKVSGRKHRDPGATLDER
ncbi:MAG: hypothetical protein HY291_17995 [Planctomycetes bacterium]|nr:hypothetical protein [Planctomycetota bacterium]